MTKSTEVCDVAQCCKASLYVISFKMENEKNRSRSDTMSRRPNLDLVKKILLTCLCLFIGASLFSQEKAINYNEVYRYPFSVGVEYQNLSPFGDYGIDFSIYDFSILLRLPLPFFPALQPLVQAGMMQFISLDRENPEKWNHVHWYGTAGIGYAHRFSKNFEIGAEFAGGVTSVQLGNVHCSAQARTSRTVTNPF